MSPKNPKVSVVIPCYNQEAFLKDCLDSVLAQTFRDYEIIVVNDGSTDSSEKIIRSYQKKHPFIRLINQENQGVVIARNTAIRQAKSPYIFPLDADDKMAPTCLEKLVAVMDQGLYDVVYPQTEFFGAISGPFELPLPDKYNMYRENCVVCSALYKKSDWEKYGGYDPNMKNGFEDWEFWLNFIEDDKAFYRLDETLLFYRQKEASRNTTIRQQHKRELVAYVKQKHQGLQKFQCKTYIPLLKKVKLILEKPFISRKKYQKKKKKALKYQVAYQNKANPKLIMTLLVKNEADILEENLIYHKAMGVDGFIITDNVSTDKTGDIIKKYQKKGWILDVILEKSQDYSQMEWVHRMMMLAKYKYRADWIISADADEFWCPQSGNIKDYLNIQNNKIYVPIYNMLSEHEDWQVNTAKVIRTFPKEVLNQLYAENKLSQFSQFSVSIPKVMVRASNYKMIAMGNHEAEMAYPLDRVVSSNIQIYHYNIRGLKHFKNKMITGGAAYARNVKFGKEVGAHWRYFYEGYKNGTLDLEEEYKKSNGALLSEEKQKYRVVQQDSTIRDFFAKEKKCVK